jgi:hypothetical protein
VRQNKTASENQKHKDKTVSENQDNGHNIDHFKVKQ